MGRPADALRRPFGDGRQGRIAYFSAAVAPARPDWEDRAASLTVVPFGSQTDVTPDDLIALWTAEGVLRPEAARRRVDEGCSSRSTARAVPPG